MLRPDYGLGNGTRTNDSDGFTMHEAVPSKVAETVRRAVTKFLGPA
jgi:tRNA U55 pseudouridine synthase TruB